jgi:hypothetical protein
MLVIYKESIKLDKISEEMHIKFKGFVKLIKVDTQQENISFWYLCDLNKKNPEYIGKKFIFLTTGQITGDNFFQDLKYIDTIKLYDDRLIFHVFEEMD